MSGGVFWIIWVIFRDVSPVLRCNSASKNILQLLTLQVIMAIVSTQKGRQAFISNRGIHFLCEINVSKIIISFRHLASCHDAVVDIVIIIIIMQVKQTFQCEDALKLLLNILTIEGA